MSIASFNPVIPSDCLSTSTHGPLIHARAVEKVARHVEDAVAKGAQVLIGGKSIPNTSFFEPTVLSDVPLDAQINKELNEVRRKMKERRDKEKKLYSNAFNF